MTKQVVKARSRKGVVSLFLEDATGVKPNRVFRLHPERALTIPADYAESMLGSSSVQKHIRSGLIIVEGGEELKEQAIEAGYIQQREAYNLEEIKKTLLGTEITKIKALFSGEDPEKARVALEIARENVEEMKAMAIKAVEQAAQTTIQVEEE